MVAPQNPPMKPQSFLLRVHAVKAVAPTRWEVRASSLEARGTADEARPIPLASLFYLEENAFNLPPMDSLIHITVDDNLTYRAIETAKAADEEVPPQSS